MTGGCTWQTSGGRGSPTDLDRFLHLFVPSIAHQPCPEREDEFNVTRILVDDIVVRFVNDGHVLQMTAEGALPDATVDSIASELRERLTVLEHTQWLLTAF
jgi:hypothetical protein